MYALIVATVLSQCGPLGCGQAAVADGWHESRTHPGQTYLYRGGRQVAGYDAGSGVYRTFDEATGIWGPPQQLGSVGQAADASPNYGLDAGRISKTERSTINGHQVTKAQAVAAATEGVPDDSKKLRLTVIGPDAERKQVLADAGGASPELAAEAKDLLVQGYDPQHWHVARAGFKTDGKPTIYLLDPTGKVLWRQDDYAGGAAELAGALRRARPDYDRSKDPGPGGSRLPWLPKFPSVPTIPEEAYVLAGVGALALIFRKRGA